MRLVELNLRNEKKAREDAYRLSGSAVVADKEGFKPVFLSLNANVLKITKILTWTLGYDRETETVVFMAGHVVVSILKGDKKLDVTVREQAFQILKGDPMPSIGEADKALDEMRYDRLYHRALELVRNPPHWGRIVDLQKRLMKENELGEKQIESIIRNAHAKVPDRVAVYDW
jgi:hypothetical protein